MLQGVCEVHVIVMQHLHINDSPAGRIRGYRDGIHRTAKGGRTAGSCSGTPDTCKPGHVVPHSTRKHSCSCATQSSYGGNTAPRTHTHAPQSTRLRRLSSLHTSDRGHTPQVLRLCQPAGRQGANWRASASKRGLLLHTEKLRFIHVNGEHKVSYAHLSSRAQCCHCCCIAITTTNIK